MNYSTISYHDYVVFADSYECQDIGICEYGSTDHNFRYLDPEYCNYELSCPRYYEFSSTIHSKFHNIGTFDGRSATGQPASSKGTYQRPALYQT